LIYHYVLKPIFWVLLHGLFKVTSAGQRNVPEGPVIVAANHLSLTDSLFIPLVHPRRFYFLAKATYFESIWTGWLLKIARQIPLGRGEDVTGSLEDVLNALDEGELVAIYPEGTRSPDGRLYRGHTGVAQLVLRSGAPVVPVGIVGSRKVLPRGGRFPNLWSRVHVHVVFGEALRFEYLGRDSKPERDRLRDVTDEIMAVIRQLSGQTYVDAYASAPPGLGAVSAELPKKRAG
jgi:1-acyl-sn-glycerol-3-phosphate acyltransferase